MKFFPALLAGGCLLALSPGSASPLGFEPGDRWACIGDSITENGRWQSWVEYFLAARVPGTSLEAFNAGIGGDMAGRALGRVGWDILPRRPTVATVMFGMNDVFRQHYGKNAPPGSEAQRTGAIDKYEANLRALIAGLQQADCRVIVMAPTFFDHEAQVPAEDLPDLDAALAECSARALAVARELECAGVATHQGLHFWNGELRRDHPGQSLISPDRIHPSSLGQLVIATVFLEQMNIAPVREIVSLEAGSGVKGEKGGEGSLRKAGSFWEGDIVFSRLPLVLQSAGGSASFLGKLHGKLGRDRLSIHGLPAGHYQLFADGTFCGILAAETLDQGVDLDTLGDFPTVRRSEKLLTLIRKKVELESRLRIPVWCEYFAYLEGRPAAPDPAEVEDRLRAWQDRSAPAVKDLIERRLGQYAEIKRQAPVLERERIELIREIGKFPIVQQVAIRLEPVAD